MGYNTSPAAPAVKSKVNAVLMEAAKNVRIAPKPSQPSHQVRERSARRPALCVLLLVAWTYS